MFASHHTISSGDAGVSQTLTHMRALVSESMADPSVVLFARSFVLRAGQREYRHQADLIQTWMRGVWVFADDPIDREFLVSPAVLLSMLTTTGRIVGDCDEAAVLGAALGQAIGMAPQFVVLGFASPDTGNDGRLAHVYTQLLTPDGDTVSLDITRPDGPLPEVTRAWVVDV